MVRRIRNSRKSRGNRAARTPQNFGKAITRATHGNQVIPPVDPPPYVSCPWWPLTITLTVTGDTPIFAIDIYNGIIRQLGFTDYVLNKETIPFEFRLVSFRCWGINKQPIQLTIFDRLGSRHRFAEMTDYGSALQYSRIGWKFGRVATLDALTKKDDGRLAEISSVGKVTVYAQVLLRTENAPMPKDVNPEINTVDLGKLSI